MMRWLLISILLCSNAFAATYYVKPGGNNASAGTSWATAWAHPNKTNGTLAYGDVVYFAPGRYDTVAIIPTVGGLTFRCAENYDDADSGRVSTILSSGIELTSNFTLRSGNIYRYDVTISPRWNTMVADGRMAVTEDDSVLMSCTSLGAVDAAGKYFYDASSDSLFVWSFGSDDPDGHTMRFSQRPVVELKNATNNITFYGLTLDMGYQATVILTYSESALLASDSITIYGCIVQNNSGYGGGVNPALIYSGNTSGGTPDSAAEWSQRNIFRKNILRHCKANSDDYSGGGAFDFYAVQKSIIDSNTIWDCYGGPFMLKYGSSGAEKADSLIIAFNYCDGGRAGLWASGRMKNLQVYGNTFRNMRTYGLDIHSTSANGSYESCSFLNNTWYRCGSSYAAVFSPEAAGSCFFQYNVFYDTIATVANTMWWKVQGGEAPEQHPLTCTYYTIDSNMYYFAGSSFAVSFEYLLGDSACSGTGSNFAAWQSAGFDVHGSATTDPHFNNQTAGDFSRLSSSAEMNRTYGGRTWTRLGAWQPDAAITDTCIQVTGKTSLGYSDTCYCIGDSLIYTFAQRDTLINTNGKDNIRIWGYHSGGGRGIIGYSASDTGNLSWPTDTVKPAIVVHVSGSDNVLIQNLAIVPRTIDDSVRQIIGVNTLTAEGVHLVNDSVITAGFASRAFQSFSTGGTASINLDLYQSYFGTASKGYNRRDQLYGATVVAGGGVKTDPDFLYTLKVHQCRIQSIHTGVGIIGASTYPIFYIDTNVIVVDARNDLYMTYDDNDVNNSAGDPYCIGIDGADSLSRISGNTLSTGTSYYGGDGMLLQHINATPTNYFEVYGNTFNGSHGAHPRIAEGRQACVGTYVRNYSSSLFVSGLHLHDNLYYITVDTNQATTYAGTYAEGVRMGFENGANGNLIENNHVSIVPRDSLTRTGAGTFEVSGLTFEQHDSTYSAGDAGTGNNVAQNNYWRVPRNPIWLGGTRIGITANNTLIIGDTVNTIYDGDSTFARFHQSGTYYSHSINNVMRNMVLQGYANYADVIKGNINTSPDSLGKQLSYQKDIAVNFKNASAANINGGSVWAIDAYNHRFDFSSTDASGNTTKALRWRFSGYDALTGDGYAVQDSTGYNDFTFWAKSGSDSVSTSATVNWSTAAINLQLPSVNPSETTILRGVTLKGVTIK